MDIRSLLSPSEPAAAASSSQDSSAIRSAAATRQKNSTTSPHRSTSVVDVNDLKHSSRHNANHTNSSISSVHRQGEIQMTRDGRRGLVQAAQQPRITHVSSSSQRPNLANRSSSTSSSDEHGKRRSGASTTSSRGRDSNLTPVHEHTYSDVRSDASINHSSADRTAHPPTLRTLSNRSLATVKMDTRPPTPRDVTSDALSADERSTVTALLSYLNENSHAYESHVQLINLLHKGFVAHHSSFDNVLPQESARTYNLLSELRQAREAMSSRFAVGEAIWQDWLHDEILLANSSEERLGLIELMQRAVQEEPASTDLWRIYVDYVENSFGVCHNLPDVDSAGWSAEDKEICRELFSQQMLSDVLQQAANSVAWRIDTSYLLWNRYLTSLQQQQSGRPDARNHSQGQSNPGQVSDIELEKLFISRLQTPHVQLEATFELFMPLIAKLYKDQYETAVSGFEKVMEQSRKRLKGREAHESKVRYALETNDQQGLFQAFDSYLKWNSSHKSRQENEKELRCSVFERALLHFPTHKDWWIAYIDYVISQQPSTHNPSASVLPLIERATRHCPWSGELWARRILRSDYERRPHDDIEATKHRATNSGLLDVGGMDELLKVLVEWCSYLRRHAFTATSTEDDLDTAEVGMTMALEDVQQAGKKLYGTDFEGDPQFRIEKIQIKLFSEARRMNDARRVWRSLVSSKKDSYEFWLQYYGWEIALWIIDRFNDKQRVETTETGPRLATAVVEEAISQHNLDWPEKIHELYVNHFQWHESVEHMQDATIIAWAFQQKIAAKRAKEAAVLAASQQTAQVDVTLPDVDAQPEEPTSGDKRKRGNSETAGTDSSNKKTKTVQDTQSSGRPGSADVQPKRDREHLSVTATNLSPDTTELDIRKLFRDCGEILSIAIVVDASEKTASAVVEFASTADVEAAKTRSGKILHDREIHIRGGDPSALYVANYPPAFDEDAIRKLFQAYGEIVSVRFPSLKYNNRRRFCYVQFVTSDQAKAAEHALDGKMLDGSHELLAKISNPDAKKQRGGAQAEGRELFVKNIDNKASEAEVRAFFSQTGDVQSINLLKNVAGRKLGSGFVIYSSAEDATKAINALNNKPLNDRILQVSLSQPKSGTAAAEKARKTDVIVKHAVDSGQTGQARRGSDVSMTSASGQAQEANDTHKTVRERQVAIFDLPDTVTDARITSEMEKHGKIVKIQLRREQNAAIVEFADVQAAFVAREGVDCRSLGPQTRTGDVQDLFSKDAKRSKSKPASSQAMMPSQLSHPAVNPSSRRGGLGMKRGGLGSARKPTDSRVTDSTTNGTARSNADFKSLFEKSRRTREE